MSTKRARKLLSPLPTYYHLEKNKRLLISSANLKQRDVLYADLILEMVGKGEGDGLGSRNLGAPCVIVLWLFMSLKAVHAPLAGMM